MTEDLDGGLKPSSLAAHRNQQGTVPSSTTKGSEPETHGRRITYSTIEPGLDDKSSRDILFCHVAIS